MDLSVNLPPQQSDVDSEKLVKLSWQSSLILAIVFHIF